MSKGCCWAYGRTGSVIATCAPKPATVTTKALPAKWSLASCPFGRGTLFVGLNESQARIISETPPIDIHPDHWKIVRRILQTHIPHAVVWVFGSRATGNAKAFSDLDIAIITTQTLPLDVSASLSDDFSESDLPYKVDVVDWATTTASFRNSIARNRVAVQ